MSLTPFKRRNVGAGTSAAERAHYSDEAEQPAADTIFGQLLDKSGIKFSSTGQPILKCDQAVFQSELAAALKNHPDHPKVIQDFIDGFIDHVDDVQKLWYALNATMTDISCTSARSGRQDALAKLLLRVLCLQTGVVKVLLEKMAELDGDDDHETMFEEVDSKRIPILILSQLRWLGSLVDSKSVCEKLMEMFSVVSLETQKEIIACVPEILEDEDHEVVASAWSKLLKEKIELTLPILDSLPNLCISNKIMTEVKTSMFATIKACRLADVPVIVKFLLHELSAENATEILTELKYVFTVSCGGGGSSQASGVVEEGKRSYQVLTLEEFGRAAENQKLVSDTLLRILEKLIREKEPFRLPDFVFLLLLLSVPARRKSAETVAVAAIRRGTLTEAVVKTAIKKYKQLCMAHFRTILQLASTLLLSADKVLIAFGSFLYRRLFSRMESERYLQEVIESLLQQALGTGPTEMEAALDVLHHLVVEQPHKIKQFGVFLKALLSRIELMSLPKVRKVYTILAHLSGIDDSQDHGLHDDLHITIHKQLANLHPKFCRMGAVGAVAALKVLLDVTGDGSQSSARRRLESIEKNVAKFVNIRALYFDELATAVVEQHLTMELEEWLAERMTNDFQKMYIVDAQPENPTRVSGICGKSQFALDEDSSEAVAIDVLSIVDSDIKSKTLVSGRGRPSVSCLLTQFRLLRLCIQSVHKNDLESVDALLGCGLFFIPEDVLEGFDSTSMAEQRFICQCQFAAINWFIEIVNAYVTQNDQEIQSKVLQRLKQIVKIRITLFSFLPEVPNFSPPVVHFDVEDELLTVAATTKVPVKVAAPIERRTKNKKHWSPSKLPGSRVLKRKILESSQCPGSSQMRESQQADKSTKKKATKPVIINLSSYALAFRELDFEVFTMLKYPLALTVKAKAKGEYLEISDLIFLAEDLQNKLKASLISSGSIAKRNFPGKVSKNEANKSSLHKMMLLMEPLKIVTTCAGHLPALLRHLEDIAEATRNAVTLEATSDDDEAMDIDTESTAVSSDKMSVAFRLLLNIFETLINWSGFDAIEHRAVLDQILETVIKTAGTQHPSNKLINKTFEYFLKMLDESLNFPTAMALIHTLEVVANKHSKAKLDRRLAETASILLKRRQIRTSSMSSDQLTKHKSLLFDLLSVYFKYSPDLLEVLESFATEAIPELLEPSEGCGETSSTYATLTRGSLPIFYRAMQEQLIGLVQTRCKQDNKDNDESFEYWYSVVKVFDTLVKIIKLFDTRQNIAVCLKHARSFLGLFVKHAMPVLDDVFRTKGEEVTVLLRHLQVATRYLQQICNYSKMKKDLRLIGQVPQLRKILEELIHRVRGMLVKHKCKDAINILSLKNRNLQGVEILSQEQNDSGSEIEDENNSETDEPIVDLDDASEIEEGSNAEDNDNSDTGNVSESY